MVKGRGKANQKQTLKGQEREGNIGKHGGGHTISGSQTPRIGFKG